MYTIVNVCSGFVTLFLHVWVEVRFELLCFTSIIAKQLIAKSMFSRIFRDKISAVPINCKHLIAKIMYFSNFWTDVYPPRIAPFWMIQYEFWSSWPDLSFELKFVFFDFFRSSSSKSSPSPSYQRKSEAKLMVNGYRLPLMFTIVYHYPKMFTYKLSARHVTGRLS